MHIGILDVGADDEISLRGACGRGARAHYALVNLASESNWDQYKKLVIGRSHMQWFLGTYLL